jgi:hypothetical protein
MTLSSNYSSQPIEGYEDEDVDISHYGPGPAFYIMWFGLLVFLFIWFWSALKNMFSRRQIPAQRDEVNGAENQLKKLSPEERKTILLECFETNKKQMVGKVPTWGSVSKMIPFSNKSVNGRPQQVVAEHILECPREDSNADDNVDMEPGLNNGCMLVFSEGDDAVERKVSNNCAICLENYSAGECVVWSSDQECPHVFHRDCIVDYLIKVKSGETPCPCCRQSFCQLFVEADEKEESTEE